MLYKSRAPNEREALSLSRLRARFTASATPPARGKIAAKIKKEEIGVINTEGERGIAERCCEEAGAYQDRVERKREWFCGIGYA